MCLLDILFTFFQNKGEQYSFKEALVLLDYRVEDIPSAAKCSTKDKVDI